MALPRLIIARRRRDEQHHDHPPSPQAGERNEESRTAGTGTGAWGRAARVGFARGGEWMVEDSAVIKQHYHMIYKEKMPHGSVKIEFNIYAPRSEIAAAFAAVDKILKREVENYASET